MDSNEHLWIVILAAGEGLRVQNLTRDRSGAPAPKQYSLVGGRTTLLGATLARARRLAPCDRIVAVVAGHHRHWWETELADLPASNIVIQPENRGTAAGILLPVLRITERDPDARFVILPSDHGVASEKILNESIAGAVTCVPHPTSRVVLLGVQPDGPETDYGWIVPKPRSNGRVRAVVSFREKPTAEGAQALFERGGLLNSFILVAGGRSLLNLFERETPVLWRLFRPPQSDDHDGSAITGDLSGLYDTLPTLDFSRDLLERAADRLRVYAVPACGWLDLGSPERLTDHLIAQGRQQQARRYERPNPQPTRTRRWTGDTAASAL